MTLHAALEHILGHPVDWSTIPPAAPVDEPPERDLHVSADDARWMQERADNNLQREPS